MHFGLVPVRAARAAAAGEELTNAYAGAGKPHWQWLTNCCFVVDPRDELASAEAARFAAVARAGAWRLRVAAKWREILTRTGPAISLLPARGRRVAPGVDRDSESSGGERYSRAASHHTSLSGRAAPRARAAAAASASSSQRHGALEGEGAADLFSFLRRTVEARPPPPPPPPPPPRDVLLHRAKRAALTEHGWATSAADAAGGDGRPELCRTGRRTELFTALHLRYVEGLLLCFTRMGKFWYGTVRCGLLLNRLFYV